MAGGLVRRRGFACSFSLPSFLSSRAERCCAPPGGVRAHRLEAIAAFRVTTPVPAAVTWWRRTRAMCLLAVLSSRLHLGWLPVFQPGGHSIGRSVGRSVGRSASRQRPPAVSYRHAHTRSHNTHCVRLVPLFPLAGFWNQARHCHEGHRQDRVPWTGHAGPRQVPGRPEPPHHA